MTKKHYLSLYFVITLVAATVATSQAQTVIGMGTEQPNPNAVLELVPEQGNQGFLAPRLTTAQRQASSFTSRLSGADHGLLVFDTNEGQFYYWFNGAWRRGTSGGTGGPSAEVSGTTWYTGTTAPGGVNAAEGDFYINESTGEVFKFSGNAFVTMGNIKGGAANSQNLSSVLQQGGSAGNQKITNLGAPTEDNDAATKGYVDDRDLENILDRDNDAGGKQITDLGSPTADGHATNRKYVDDQDNTVRSEAKITNFFFNEGNNELTLTEGGTLYTVGLTSLDDGGTPTTLPEGNIFVGDNSSSPQAVTITGDISISSTGVMTINNARVTAATINADVAGDGLSKHATNGSLQVNAGSGLKIDSDTVKITPFPDGWIGIGQGLGNDIDFKEVKKDATLNNDGELTVRGLQGRSIAGNAPSNNQILKWNASANDGNGQWEPATVAGVGSDTPVISTGTDEPADGSGKVGDIYIRNEDEVFIKINNDVEKQWLKVKGKN